MSKPKYSKTFLKDIDSLLAGADIKYNPCTNEGELTYKFRYNSVKKRWSCNCQGARFQESRGKYCKHLIAFLKFTDKLAYKKEIEEE